jgi:hypothetical protein
MSVNSDSSTGTVTAESDTPAIQRAAGKTKSERYLASLAERSFLDLWSYPNVFVDRRSNGERSDGKELCDLLVVCGDHVLIFSDKSIAWPVVDDPELAWSRWFRRAVKKSADQVRGAERWITKHPDRLFLDPACSKPFPLELKRGTSSRFARGFIPPPIHKTRGTAYIFMLLSRPDGLAGGYQQYRELRSSMLYG